MSRNFASSLVPLSPRHRLDINVYLALNKKNTRQGQKLKTLQRYIEQYSSGWKKRLELADLLYEIGLWPNAIAEYNQVIEKQPHLIKPRVKLGKILQLTGQTEAAISVYRSALSYAQQAATKQHLMGLIAACQDNNRDAIAAFQTATTLEPQNINHLFALGKMQMEMEYPAEALASFESLLSLAPDDLMGLIYSYDLLLTLGKLPEADSRLNKVLEIAPEDVQTLKRVIMSRCRKGLLINTAGKQTKKLIITLLKQAPSLPIAHNLLAQYYIGRKEPKKALEIMQNFTEEYTNNPHGWYYYSVCLFELGDNSAAAEAILMAYNLSQGKCDREIYRALCKILPTTEQPEQTHSIITEMLTYFPKSWSLWASAGKILAEYFEDNKRGHQYSLQATQLNPRLADPWFYHGNVLLITEQYQAAVEALTKGWQLLLPQSHYLKSVSAAVWLGTSCQKLGRYQEGKKWLHLACQHAEQLISFESVRALYWKNQALAGLQNRHYRKRATGRAKKLGETLRSN